MNTYILMFLCLYIPCLSGITVPDKVCPDGFDYTDDRCTRTHVAKREQRCPAGYEPHILKKGSENAGTNLQCKRSVPSDILYVCNHGTIQQGGRCLAIKYVPYVYTCPKDDGSKYVLSGTQCHREVKKECTAHNQNLHQEMHDTIPQTCSEVQKLDAHRRCPSESKEVNGKCQVEVWSDPEPKCAGKMTEGGCYNEEHVKPTHTCPTGFVESDHVAKYETGVCHMTEIELPSLVCPSGTKTVRQQGEMICKED